VPLYFLRVLIVFPVPASRPPPGAPIKSPVDGAKRRAGAHTANAGTKTEKPGLAAVAAPRAKQPPAQELQKRKRLKQIAATA